MSALDFLKPILKFLPEVKSPATPPSFSERLIWTFLALAIFFVMYNIVAVGVDPRLAGQSDFLQVVTASKLGSLITTGIGPIVLASIFLQLFAGAKIIDINMKDPEQKVVYFGTQKLLAFTLCLFEACAFVFLGHLPVVSIPGMDASVVLFTLFGVTFSAVQILVMAQIAMGSVILLYLDEVVAKHGIGSGISLFIAAGVSLAIVGGTVQLFTGDNGVFAQLATGGAEVIAKALFVLLPLFFTILVFLVIVYVEGMKVDIPLAFDRARGIGGGLPIKFTYVSNMPVILALALVGNAQLFSGVLIDQHFCITGHAIPNAPDVYNACGQGGIDLINYVGRTLGGKGVAPQPVDGLLYLISPIGRTPGNNYAGYFESIISNPSPVLHIPGWVHIITYIIFLMTVCVIFGQFWVETTGMGPKDVAEQLDSAGMQIPGYRRDPRIVAAMLEKYIPPIVIMGSAFVGLLAALADLTGALGTGTGILLTVGIVYKMYQDMERQNAFSSNALMAKLMGK